MTENIVERDFRQHQEAKANWQELNRIWDEYTAAQLPEEEKEDRCYPIWKKFAQELIAGTQMAAQDIAHEREMAWEEQMMLSVDMLCGTMLDIFRLGQRNPNFKQFIHDCEVTRQNPRTHWDEN